MLMDYVERVPHEFFRHEGTMPGEDASAFSGAVVIVGGIVLVIEVAFDLDAWRSLPPVPHLEDDDLVLADLIVDEVRHP